MLTQGRLKQLLVYSPTLGEFRWRESGEVAGRVNRIGYWMVRIGRKDYLAHRLVWLYVHGTWPEWIDHRNRDRSDNRLENLRDVPPAINLLNGPLRRNNTSGVTGVQFKARDKRWQATLGKRVLGYFRTCEEAATVRRLAEAEVDATWTGAL